MRVALVHLRHARSGGTERYLDRLARFLAERGHAVTIVCRSHAEAPHPAVRFATLRPLAVGGAWRVLSFARAVERHVEGGGYDVVYGLGRTWSQDVIRLGGGCQRTYLERAHAATRTPLERLLRSGALKQRIAVAIEERALGPGSAAHVVANSEMVARDVQARYGLPRERVTVIHNGVDLVRFHPRRRTAEGAVLRAELGLAPEAFVVLFLGSGYARKGLDLVLAGMPGVLRARPDARLVVAGFDSGRPRYEARSRALGLADRARFLGGRLDPEAVYAASDLYVLPTRYDPFANSTLEALASGLPVVTTTANGGAELVQPGTDGSVVDLASDPGGVAREMLAWSTDGRARAASAAARAKAEMHGEASKFAAAEALLQRAAGAGVGGRARA